VSTPQDDLDPVQLLSLLASDDRLRVFAALVLGATSADEISLRAGLPVKHVLRALSQLARGGLASREGTAWGAVPMVLRRCVAAVLPQPPPEDLGDRPAAEAAVWRSFMRDGRITSMPAHRAKRQVLLDHVARVFEPGARYRESEVNALLRVFYDDHATLRRYLVDGGFLSRDHGEYWRSGGTVDI
jgi:hypothetical protein